MKILCIRTVFRDFWVSAQKSPSGKAWAARRLIRFFTVFLVLAWTAWRRWIPARRRDTICVFLVVLMLFVRKSMWFLELRCVYPIRCLASMKLFKIIGMSKCWKHSCMIIHDHIFKFWEGVNWGWFQRVRAKWILRIELGREIQLLYENLCILVHLATGIPTRKGLIYSQVGKNLVFGLVLICRLAASCLPPGDDDAQTLFCEFR